MAQLQTTAVTGSLTVTGQIIAQTLNVQQVTSSIVYSSGSNRFGNLVTDVQQMTGSLRVTGSGDHYIVGGNIGINTSIPSAILHSVGSGIVNIVQSSNTVSYTQYYNTSTGTNSSNDGLTVGNNGTAAYIYNREADALIFGTSNLERGRFTAGGTFLVGDTVTPAEVAWFGTAALGKNGTNKVIIGYLSSTTNGAVIGGHNSALNAWAELNINATNVIFRSNESETMRLASTGNLGIGTTVPSQLVEAYKSSNADIVYQITNPNTGTSATAQFFASNGTTRSQFFHTGTSYSGTGILSAASNLGGIYNNQRGIALIAASATGSILFSTNTSNAERMRIASDGNVGIGTTSPAAKLQVSGSSNVLNVVGSGSLSTSSLFSVDGAFGRLFEVTDDLSNSLFSVNTIAGLPVIEAFADYSVNLGTYSAASGSTMRITGSSVGIGTTNPTMNLQIDSTGFSFRLRERSDGSSLVLSGNQIQARTSANGGSALYLNFTNSGEIYTGAGNVGIGTTSTARKLTVWQTIDGQYGQYIYHGGTNGSSYGLLIDAGATSVDAGLRVRSKAGTDYFIIKGDGTVGIGTTGPQYKLHVVGEIFASTNLFGNIVYTNTIRDQSGGVVSIQDDAGNVGIGTTTPLSKLEVDIASAVSASGIFLDMTGGTGGAIDLRLGSSVGPHIVSNTLPDNTVRGNYGASRMFFTSLGFSFDYSSTTTGTRTWNTYAVINTSGNLGIGTTSPGGKLDLAFTSGEAATALILRTTDSTAGNGTIRWRDNANNNEAAIGSSFNVGDPGALEFLNGSTTNMILRSTGNLGIGTTSPVSRLNISDGASMYAAATGEMLQIKRNVTNGTDAGQVRLTLGNNSNTFAIVYGGTTDRLRFIDGGPTEILSLVNGGNVGIGSIAPDARLTVSASSGDLATFYTGATKRLTITTGGNLSFSTSTSLGLLWSPASLLFEGQTQGIVARPFASNYVSFTVAGATGQTANLQTWQAQGGTVYSVVDANGDFAIQATASIGKLQLGSDWKANPEATNTIYLSSTGFTNVNLAPEIIVTSNTSATTPGGTIGLALHNTNVTAGAFSPLLVFSKRETGSSDYNAAIAAIGARTVTGTGGGSSWIDGDLMFYTAPSAGAGLVERMRIIQDGNVGIGTSSPAAELEVVGASGWTGVYASSGARFLAIASDSAAQNDIHWDSASDLRFSTATNKAVSGYSEKMRITSAGNVGIGTTSPSYLLTVGAAGTTTDSYIQIATSTTGTGNLFFGDATGGGAASFAGFLQYLHTNNALLIGTNSTEKMRIDSNGNVGIGTTSPIARLHVSGTSGTIFEVDGANAINSLYVNSSGEVGIGTTTTGGYRLLAVNNITSYPFTTAGFLSTSATASFNIGFSGGTSWANGYVSRLTFQSDNIPNGAYAPTDKWFVGINATADGVGNTALVFYDAKNNAERIRIDATGNVGIGITNPSHPLTIYNSSNSATVYQTSGTGTGGATGFYVGHVANISYVWNYNNFPLVLATNNIERVRILADGNVGIGSTAPTQKLDVVGAIKTTSNILLPTDGMIDWGSGDARIVEGEVSNYSLSFKLYDPLTTTVPTRLFMSASGNVGIGTTSPAYRLDIVQGGTLAFGAKPFGDNNTNYNRLFEPAGNIAIYLGNASDPANYYDNTSHYFRNRGGGTTYAFINTNGSVGLGTTSPTARLHVQGTTVISGSLNLSGSAVGLPEHMVVALSDETTNITTGTAKVTMRAPFAMRLTDLPRASLSTASTSGLVTVDINEAGTSVLGANKLSIDANELTSTTAATPTTIADALIADDAQITFDIDGAGTGAKGLKVTLYYIRV